MRDANSSRDLNQVISIILFLSAISTHAILNKNISIMVSGIIIFLVLFLFSLFIPHNSRRDIFTTTLITLSLLLSLHLLGRNISLVTIDNISFGGNIGDELVYINYVLDNFQKPINEFIEGLNNFSYLNLTDYGYERSINFLYFVILKYLSIFISIFSKPDYLNLTIFNLIPTGILLYIYNFSYRNYTRYIYFVSYPLIVLFSGVLLKDIWVAMFIALFINILIYYKGKFKYLILLFVIILSEFLRQMVSVVLTICLIAYIIDRKFSTYSRLIVFSTLILCTSFVLLVKYNDLFLYKTLIYQKATSNTAEFLVSLPVIIRVPLSCLIMMYVPIPPWQFLLKGYQGRMQAFLYDISAIFWGIGVMPFIWCYYFNRILTFHKEKVNSLVAISSLLFINFSLTMAYAGRIDIRWRFMILFPSFVLALEGMKVGKKYVVLITSISYVICLIILLGIKAA